MKMYFSHDLSATYLHVKHLAYYIYCDGADPNYYNSELWFDGQPPNPSII